MNQQSFFITEEEIGAQFKKRLIDGHDGDCPACGRYCKVYHRKLHSGIARQLIALHRFASTMLEGEFVHSSAIRKVCGGYADFTLAKHWGLVRARVNISEPNKKDNGYWQLTADGVAFVRGHIEIAKYLYLFDDQAIGQSEETVDIREVLGKKFNYAELMELSQ